MDTYDLKRFLRPRHRRWADTLDKLQQRLESAVVEDAAMAEYTGIYALDVFQLHDEVASLFAVCHRIGLRAALNELVDIYGLSLLNRWGNISYLHNTRFERNANEGEQLLLDHEAIF